MPPKLPVSPKLKNSDLTQEERNELQYLTHYGIIATKALSDQDPGKASVRGFLKYCSKKQIDLFRPDGRGTESSIQTACLNVVYSYQRTTDWKKKVTSEQAPNAFKYLQDIRAEIAPSHIGADHFTLPGSRIPRRMNTEDDNSSFDDNSEENSLHTPSNFRAKKAFQAPSPVRSKVQDPSPVRSRPSVPFASPPVPSNLFVPVPATTSFKMDPSNAPEDTSDILWEDSMRLNNVIGLDPYHPEKNARGIEVVRTENVEVTGVSVPKETVTKFTVIMAVGSVNTALGSKVHGKISMGGDAVIVQIPTQDMVVLEERVKYLKLIRKKFQDGYAVQENKVCLCQARLQVTFCNLILTLNSYSANGFVVPTQLKQNHTALMNVKKREGNVHVPDEYVITDIVERTYHEEVPLNKVIFKFPDGETVNNHYFNDGVASTEDEHTVEIKVFSVTKDLLSNVLKEVRAHEKDFRQKIRDSLQSISFIGFEVAVDGTNVAIEIKPKAARKKSSRMHDLVESEEDSPLKAKDSGDY
jgi:hypothetical protein